MDTDDLLPEANKHHVSFLPGSCFSSQLDLKNYLRLSFAYYEEHELRAAAIRLAKVINSSFTSM